MPATFQKTIDVTLRNCHNKFAFLDDILVITKGNIADHEKELDKMLLDKENLAIKLQKCEFAKKTNNLVRVRNNTNWYNTNEK